MSICMKIKQLSETLTTLAKTAIDLLSHRRDFLACGYVGKGRLEEPEKIVTLVQENFLVKTHLKNSSEYLPLTGKKVVITAGPTRERIDPVRYVSNFSSGKMGYAMADAAAKLGAETILVSGPVSLDPPAGVQVIQIESAAEMFEAVTQNYE